eukprot:PhM_4_TR3064/c4_g1_i1/m.90989
MPHGAYSPYPNRNSESDVYSSTSELMTCTAGTYVASWHGHHCSWRAHDPSGHSTMFLSLHCAEPPHGTALQLPSHAYMPLGHPHSVALVVHVPSRHLAGRSGGHVQCAASSEHSLFQHLTMSAGHCASHLASVAAHLVLPGQRTGASAGHGHGVVEFWQEPSQHCTFGGLHVDVSHSVCCSTHAFVLGQRTGADCGHGHSSYDALQLLSQHCTWCDGHVMHSALVAAHSPVCLQRTGADCGHGHARAESAHEPSAHCTRSHFAAHMVMLCTQMPVFGQRVGRFGGHAHAAIDAWHSLFQHITSSDSHCLKHSLREGAHMPEFAQRTEPVGHAHFAGESAHEPSGQVTFSAGHMSTVPGASVVFEEGALVVGAFVTLVGSSVLGPGASVVF